MSTDLMLTDEEIRAIKESDYPIHNGKSPMNSLYYALLKAQLAKVHPRITELEGKIAELEALIEWVNSNIGLWNHGAEWQAKYQQLKIEEGK